MLPSSIYTSHHHDTALVHCRGSRSLDAVRARQGHGTGLHNLLCSLLLGLYRCLHLLGSPSRAPPADLQARTQAPSQVASTDSFRLARLPPSRWIHAVAAVSHLRLPIPSTPIRVHGTLRLCQLLVDSHPRQRRHCQLATRKDHQWTFTSHSSPLVL